MVIPRERIEARLADLALMYPGECDPWVTDPAHEVWAIRVDANLDELLRSQAR